jgi:hypothetical protein
MKIQITDIKVSRIVTTVPVFLKGGNYRPSEQEAFDVAWEAAVDDGLVDLNRRGDYSFRALGAGT